MKKWDQAIEHWEKALQLNPKYAEAHFNLGQAYFEKGEIQKAIGELKEALTWDQDLLEARGNLCLLILETGNIDEAREMLTEAQELAHKLGKGKYAQKLRQDFEKKIDELDSQGRFSPMETLEKDASREPLVHEKEEEAEEAPKSGEDATADMKQSHPTQEYVPKEYIPEEQIPGVTYMEDWISDTNLPGEDFEL